MLLTRLIGVTAVLTSSLSLRAQEPPAPPPAENRERPPAESRERPQAQRARRARPDEPQFDEAAVERGKALLVARCGFCHGSNARGGAGGVDLTRSALVQEDENGKQLGEFLKVGRPERNMPKFELTAQEVSDLATFLHATIHLVAHRDLYNVLDIVTGDAKAGEAYFNGAGGCRSCHSSDGDLKGIGAKYEPAALQGKVLMPREGPVWGPRGGRMLPPFLDKNAVKATVTLPSGESFTGAMVRVSDFDVTIYDPEAKRTRSFLRNDGVPKVALTDPLQGHIDLWRKWTDENMHNVTAYLVGLK
jgi:cytochrome c oxidase cbb3-type subunit III